MRSGLSIVALPDGCDREVVSADGDIEELESLLASLVSKSAARGVSSSRPRLTSEPVSSRCLLDSGAELREIVSADFFRFPRAGSLIDIG
jgi:hypothetical protein